MVRVLELGLLAEVLELRPPEASPTLDGSFSAVWTATIASKDAFCSIFRDLQDLHSFAPLESQVEKNTMKNHLENPDEQASSKQSPGEQYRAGKQTSDSTTTNGGGSVGG